MEDSITKVNRVKKIRFEKSGYYFIGLVAIMFLGFWPTYFSKYFDGTANFNLYFHFHFMMASLWIGLLIVQPLLIKKKKLAIHKQIGKFSFIILPLFIISVILLKHHQIEGKVTEGLGASLWLQLKDIIVISVMYTIAIVNKHTIQIHARAMIATGIVFIEPTLGRFIILTVLPEPNFIHGLGITVAIMYTLIISLIIFERKQTSGRWVFPLLLLLFMVFHYLIFNQVSFPFWDSFAKWFAELPLT
jgi:hypothetical protein